MAAEVVLTVGGLVDPPVAFTWSDLAHFDAAAQVPDVGTIVAGRQGGAIRLEALLRSLQVGSEPRFLTLHASRDDFHASIPLEAVRAKGLLVYRLAEGPLPVALGGPVRFLIPDPAACHSAEVDECASVKFVDRIELSRDRGNDNRPADERAHAQLHAESDHGE